MKIRGISKDRSPKCFEIDTLKIYIKPLDQNMRTSFTGKAWAGDADLLNDHAKKYFARTHVVDWEGMVDDETGKPVEYSQADAIAILSDESNDDFFHECFNFAYKLANVSDEAQEKDKEDAKKK